METKVKPTVETWLCRGYLFLMLALLPLAVHNGFFDITETKTICFTVPTVVFVLARLGFTLYRENGLPCRRLAGAEWAALALCLICFIASAAGGDFAGSFLGERGRYQGLGMMWLYAALYFAFSGARVRSGDVLVPLGLGLFLSGALTVCNHLGYDVLGFCSQLGEFDRGRYISTLGNINFAGAYLTLVWPVCAAALLTERRPWKGILLGIVCVGRRWRCGARARCSVSARRSCCCRCLRKRSRTRYGGIRCFSLEQRFPCSLTGRSFMISENGSPRSDGIFRNRR